MFVIRKKNTELFLPKGRHPDRLSLVNRTDAPPWQFRSKGAAASVLKMWLGGPFTTWNEGFNGEEGYWTQTPQPDRVPEDMEVIEVNGADSDYLPRQRHGSAVAG